MTILEKVPAISAATPPKEEKTMPEKTAAQKKAQQKYMEKFVRVEIRMETEKRAIIQAHAETQGQSVNAYITAAIAEKMERDKEKAGE